MTRILTVVLLIGLWPGSVGAHDALKLVGGRWYTGHGFEERTVWVVDGVLRTTHEGEAITVDLGGGWVVPPYGDAHNHAFGDPRVVAADTLRFLRAGVFYVKNPNNLGDRVAEVRKALLGELGVDVAFANGGLTASGGHPGPLYTHLAGQGAFPGLGPDDMDGRAYFAIDTDADVQRRWPDILAGRPDFLKVYLERSERAERHGLDPRLVPAIVERAHAAGLPVTAHVTSAADFRSAIAAGVDEIAHLPLEPITDDDARAAAARGTVVVTTTLSHRPAPDGLDVAAVHRQNLTRLKEAGVAVVLGVDGAPTVVEEALSVAALGVFEPGEVLRMLVDSTPRAIFPDRRIGELADGREASFLVLDGDPREDLDALTRIRLRVKQGHVLELPAEKQHVTELIVPIVLREGVEPALRELDRLVREASDRYEVGEIALNRVGYVLLRHGRTAAAIEVFHANAERYPTSANVWDSLGEAYLASGDEARALGHYRRSLELNPHNDHAREVVRKLGAPKP